MYEWKWAELVWAAGVAIVVFILGELLLFDVAAIDDWRTWALALASGSIRAAAGALLAIIRPRSP